MVIDFVFIIFFARGDSDRSKKVINGNGLPNTNSNDFPKTKKFDFSAEDLKKDLCLFTASVARCPLKSSSL